MRKLMNFCATYGGAILISVGLLGAGLSAQSSILPPNDLYLEDDIDRKDANIDEFRFNKIIDDIMEIYTPIIASHGATLETRKRWTDSTVNASAQQIGKKWIVNMYGGLARRPEVTPDGFALVVCHELGHHLAGFALKGGRWAASEGQSDYFATQTCSRMIWGDDLEQNAKSANAVHPIAKRECDGVWKSEADRNLCYRGAMAGESLARLLGALRNQVPKFETPSQREVRRTSTSHPAAQCRLDTYFSGALCAVNFDPMKIPGRNHPDGQQSAGAEIESNRYQCSRAEFHGVGTRPRCWYKPEVPSMLQLQDVTVTQTSGDADNAREPGEAFRIDAELKNLGSAGYEGVVLSLNSESTAFETITGEVQIPKVKPGSKMNMSPLQFKVANNAKCGENVEFGINMAVDGLAPISVMSETFMVGRFQSVGQFGNGNKVEIPDGDRNVGVTSELNVNAPATFTRIEAEVNITHPYQGNIMITLISPTGDAKVLRRYKGGSRDNINETFAIPVVQGRDYNGTWKLNVRDRWRRNVGTLDNWAIKFSNTVCD